MDNSNATSNKALNVFDQPSCDLSHLRILIVEDNKDARFLLHKMLTNMGVCDVYEAQSGYEAVTFLEESYELIDAILCDWVLPGMDGADLLARVRSVDADMPFVMVTGLNDRQSVEEAAKAGVSAYVTKPINPDILEAKLRIIKHNS